MKLFFQTLDKVEWSDAGIYSCLAKEVGSDGLPTRQDIILDIYGKKTTVFKAAILEFSMTVSFLCENVRMGSQA